MSRRDIMNPRERPSPRYGLSDDALNDLKNKTGDCKRFTGAFAKATGAKFPRGFCGQECDHDDQDHEKGRMSKLLSKEMFMSNTWTRILYIAVVLCSVVGALTVNFMDTIEPNG